MRHNQEHESYRSYKLKRNGLIIAVAALIIIPLCLWAWISHDDYTHAMERKGCYIVNTFDSGAHVWQCPAGVK